MGVVLSKLDSCFRNRPKRPGGVAVPTQLGNVPAQSSVALTTIEPNPPVEPNPPLGGLLEPTTTIIHQDTNAATPTGEEIILSTGTPEVSPGLSLLSATGVSDNDTHPVLAKNFNTDSPSVSPQPLAQALNKGPDPVLIGEVNKDTSGVSPQPSSKPPNVDPPHLSRGSINANSTDVSQQTSTKSVVKGTGPGMTSTAPRSTSTPATPGPKSAGITPGNKTVSGGPSLWGQAVERIRLEKPGRFDSGEVTKLETVQGLIQEVESIQTNNESKRWCYVNKKGEPVYYAEGFLKQLNTFVVIGDIAIQHNPDVVALVWAGFRLLLKVGTAHVGNMEMISSSLTYLGWILCVGELYEGVYTDTAKASVMRLREQLVKQYVSILNYLLCVKEHLHKNTAVRIAEAFSTKLANLLDDIRNSEKETRDCADLAEKESAVMARLEQGSHLNVLIENLKILRDQTSDIESTLDDCNSQLKRLCDFLGETQYKTIINWVSTVQYGAIHERYSKGRAPNTCTWLQRNDIYDSWLNYRTPSGVLWMHGNAGTGKSILSSKVIDTLKRLPITENYIAYYYCSKESLDHKEPASVLVRAIVKQLCLANSSEALPSSLVKLYKKRSDDAAGSLSCDECIDLIIELSEQVSRVWIVIDALDECGLSTRQSLFSMITKIADQVKDIRFFLTSRNEADIHAHMHIFNEICIQAEDNSEDIRSYLESELKRLSNNKPTAIAALFENRKDDINSLAKDADGLFLSVHLRMQNLMLQTDEVGIDDALNDNLIGLDHLYENMIDRITSQSKTKRWSAFHLIKWLLHTIDDSTPATVLQALQLHTDTVSSLSPNLKLSVSKININQFDHICCGLVIHDKDTGILRLSHVTVVEFMERVHKELIYEGEEWILKVCREVLENGEYEDEEVYSSDRPQRSLLNYSTRNWGHHLRLLRLRSPGAAPEWDNFLDESSKRYKAWASHVRAEIPVMAAREGEIISPLWVACYYRLFDMFKKLLPKHHLDCVNSAGQNPLHHSAENGYLEFVEELLGTARIDANCTDDMDHTPLMIATRTNQIKVVEALLARSDGLDVNMIDKDSRNALMHAALYDRVIITKLLIGTKKCKLNGKDKHGFTALHQAAISGHALVVDSLLQLAPDIETNSTDLKGMTPLWGAIMSDHREVVNVLVNDRRVNINAQFQLLSVLWFAVGANIEWLVKLLLQRDDLDIQAQTENGWTALSFAAWNGSLKALQYIVNVPGFDINHEDRDGDTPLTLAALRGHTDVVSFLLQIGPPEKTQPIVVKPSTPFGNADDPEILSRHHVNINHRNLAGATALWLAARKRDVPTVETLLSHGVSVNIGPQSGMSALHCALIGSGNHNMGLVRILLSHGADVNAKSRDLCLTPLHIASQFGNIDAVKILVERGADIEAKSIASSTPLLFAAHYGCTESLRALMSLGANPAIIDDNGHNLLHVAAANGEVDAVEFLLSTGTDVNLVDPGGFTPLHLAITAGEEDVTKLLLSHGALAHLEDADGHTPLHSAAAMNHSRLIQVLLSHGLKIDALTKGGSTPLHLAARWGHKDSIEVLLGLGAKMELADEEGRTALHRAVQYRYQEAVRTLLSQGANIEPVDRHGHTPLNTASLQADKDMVQILLSNGADIHARNGKGKTSLHLAGGAGHKEIVEVLLEHGAHVESTDPDGHTVLYYTAIMNHSEALQTVLLHGANPNVVDKMGLTALNYAVARDCLDAVQTLLSHGADIHTVAELGQTYLHFAAGSGGRDIIRILIEHGADMNSIDEVTNTPLHTAVRKGNVEVTAALLSHGASATAGLVSGYTPLFLAVTGGHVAIFEMLLPLYENIEMNGDSQMPLLLAARFGNTRMVELVLERGGHNVNHRNKGGETALFWAVNGEHNEIVKMLLKENDIDVKIANKGGLTPLLLAARKGHIGLFQTILSRYDPTDKLQEMDEEDNTPLLVASTSGQSRLVELLLERGGHNINHHNKRGATALLCATKEGDVKSVEMLLQVDDIDITYIAGEDGVSPLSLAACIGHVEIFELILSQYEKKGKLQEIDCEDNGPLLFASRLGHARIIEMLLDRAGCNVNHKSKNCDIALSCAVLGEHTESVKMLMRQESIDFTITNKYGITPLTIAAKVGNVEIFEMILSQYETTGRLQEIDEEDIGPLIIATSSGHIQIVEFLLNRCRYNVNHRHRDGRTALFIGVQREFTEIVEILMKEDNIDVNIANGEGLSPLMWAAAKGYDKTFQMMLPRDMKKNQLLKVTNGGTTLLILAATYGHTRIVELILKSGAYDINQKCTLGYTALLSAARGDNTELVEMLLKEEDIKVSIASNHGSTSLLIAAEHGHVEIFEMILERYDQTDKLQEMDGDHDTPLLAAAESGKARILELVLERGGHDINHKNKSGETALIRASANGHVEVVERLLKEDGIDVSITNAEGKSAYGVAKEGDHDGVLALLAPRV